MLRFHLCTIVIISLDVYHVGASTTSPLPSCSQSDINSLLNKDFCTNGDITVFTGSTKPCLVTPTKTSGATLKINSCTGDYGQLCSFKPTTMKKNTSCKYKGKLYSWDRKEKRCKIRDFQAGQKKNNYTTCHKDPANDIDTCSPSQLQRGELAKNLCTQELSTTNTLSLLDGRSCVLKPLEIPPVYYGGTAKTGCLTQGGMSDGQETNLPASSSGKKAAETALAECPKKFRGPKIWCLYKAAVVIGWHLNKPCLKLFKKVRQEHSRGCSAAVTTAVDNLLALSSRNVDTRSVDECPVSELLPLNTKRWFKCFYRGEYYHWKLSDGMPCRVPPDKKPNLHFNGWEYCNEDALRNLTAASPQIPEARKRKASAEMTLIGQSQPQEPKISRAQLASQVQDWVVGALAPLPVAVQDVELVQPGSSFWKRSAENTNPMIRRKLSQTSGSILVKFTVVADSRQVQGIDFADEVQRSMKESAHAFGGPGDNFRIDPSSIQVQEVDPDVEKSSSSSDNSDVKYIIVLVISGTIILMGISIVGFFMYMKLRSQRSAAKGLLPTTSNRGTSARQSHHHS